MVVSIFSPNSSQTVRRKQQIPTCIEKKKLTLTPHTKDASSLGRLGIFDLQCYPFQLLPPKIPQIFQVLNLPVKKKRPLFFVRVPPHFFSQKKVRVSWIFPRKLQTSGRSLKPWNVCLKSHISKIVLKKSVEVSRTKVFVQNHFFRVFGCLYVREISLQVEFKKLACVNKVAPIKWWIGQVLTIILTFWRGWISCQQMTRWRQIFLVWFLNGHSDFTQHAAGTCVYYFFW